MISYDTITEAIEHELAAERINLLETLAERVAARCLADRRAVRVFVRIEKLDRIPGALGVEIVRTRLRDEARGCARSTRPRAGDRAPAARGLPRAELAGGAGRGATRWRRGGSPSCSASAPAAPQPAAATEAQRRIGLLAIEQAAWALRRRATRASRSPRPAPSSTGR